MIAMCIDASSHNDDELPPDLTELNNYELGEECGCGKHVLVLEDDAGESAFYLHSRFIPLSNETWFKRESERFWEHATKTV